jgi:DnaJ-class molecular chaperone
MSYGQRFAKPPDNPRRQFRSTSSGNYTALRRPSRAVLPNDTCLRCKGKGHWAADCKSEGRFSMTEAIAARLPGATSDQVVKVIYQLSSEFDAAEQEREGAIGNETVEEDFGQLYNTFYALMNGNDEAQNDDVARPDFQSPRGM